MVDINTIKLKNLELLGSPNRNISYDNYLKMTICLCLIYEYISAIYDLNKSKVAMIGIDIPANNDSKNKIDSYLRDISFNSSQDGNLIVNIAANCLDMENFLIHTEQYRSSRVVSAITNQIFTKIQELLAKFY